MKPGFYHCLEQNEIWCVMPNGALLFLTNRSFLTGKKLKSFHWEGSYNSKIPWKAKFIGDLF